MTDREPRVSVVMSVFDGADHLDGALASVLAQDFADFELIVVDDGSTDATPEILARCTDPRLQVIRQANAGYVAAWERALAVATAPLVARMDADDTAAPDRFARQVALLDARPEVGLVGTGGRLLDVDGRVVGAHATYAGDFALRLALMRGNPFLHGSVMYRRAVLDRVGGYRADRYPAEDYDLWCRMAVAGERIANLPDPLYDYRRHESSVSATERGRQDGAARSIRDEFAPLLAAQVLTPAAVQRAAAEYGCHPDPRVRAEWPAAVQLLVRALAREARGGSVGEAARTYAAALAVSPAVTVRATVRTATRTRPPAPTVAPAMAPDARDARRAPADRLRVMFVLDSLGPGGTERSTALLLPALRERAVDGEVVCLRHAEDGDEARVVEAGFPVTVLGGSTLPARVVALRRHIRASRPDVVHTAIYHADIVGRIAAAGTGVPVISSLISTPYAPARRADPRVTPWKLEVARIVDGVTARYLTVRLHAVSEGTAEANCAALHLDPTRVTVVERGRPVDAFAPLDADARSALRRRLGVADDDRLVLALGRQAYQKGFPDLVAASAAVIREDPRVRCWIAGAPGPATPDIDAARAALPPEVAARVEVLGYRDDVPDLLHAADVFVMSSHWEGTAGAVLEAMAGALPIVTTDVDGLRGIVTDGVDATVVPVGDPQALASALAEVLTDDVAARARGARAREAFEQRFSLGASADRMATLYREIAAQGAEARGR